MEGFILTRRKCRFNHAMMDKRFLSNFYREMRIRKFFIFVLTTIFAITLSSQILPASAQENLISPSPTDETNVNDISIKLSKGEQSPMNKEVDLIATIDSNVDSDRVIVKWTLTPQIYLADKNASEEQIITISKGVQSTRIRVKAAYGGKSEIEVNVTAVKADVNYIASDKMEVEFNDSLEILPLTDEYKKNKLIYQLVMLLASLIFIGIMAFTGRWLYKRYKYAQEQL